MFQNAAKSCGRFCAQGTSGSPVTAESVADGGVSDGEGSDVTDAEGDEGGDEDADGRETRDENIDSGGGNKLANFKWENFLGTTFDLMKGKDLVAYYNSLDKELGAYRNLTGMWTFTFSGGASVERERAHGRRRIAIAGY